MNLDTDIFDIAFYPGLTAQDVIPELIKKLKITFAKLDKDSIQYQAIQTYIKLLQNYLTIATTDSIQTQETLSFFNELSLYLQEYAKNAYPQLDTYIRPRGRIKSPISANKKIKEKIASALKNGKPLDEIKISDFIAFRFIVEVRDAYGNLVPESLSVSICYRLVEEAMEFIKARETLTLTKVSSVKQNDNIPDDIYHPITRPAYIEKNLAYIKDFIFMPKPGSNYQSEHLQFVLTPSNGDLPISGEFQFRTFLMNEYAERGHASHKKYKTREKISYLAIPQILKPITPFSSQVDFIKPDDAFTEFLGFSPQTISPFMSYDFLKQFLQDNGYSYPVLPLYYRESEDGTIFIFDDLKAHQLPLDIVSLDNQKQMQVLIGDIFDEKNFEQTPQETFDKEFT